MQSTGHSSTQARSLISTQGRAMTYVTKRSSRLDAASRAARRNCTGSVADIARPVASGQGGTMAISGHGLWADDSLERLATGARWLEGPAWVGDRLLVSDIPGNRVLSWRPGQTEFEVAIPDAEFTNGRTLARDGRVYQCSHGRRGVEELHPDLTTSLLIDSHDGVRLNSPNDLIVARDGAIWFTCLLY